MLNYLEKNPKVAEEIETAIRTKAGLISKKIEGNPTPKEKETENKDIFIIFPHERCPCTFRDFLI